MKKQQTKEPNRPTHGVYQVQGEGEKAFWNKIGAAWLHKDGKGANPMLDAIPLNRPHRGPGNHRAGQRRTGGKRRRQRSSAMSSFSRPTRLAADAYEARVENAITRPDDLYELDGETFLRNRGGRIETGSAETFEREAW